MNRLILITRNKAGGTKTNSYATFQKEIFEDGKSVCIDERKMQASASEIVGRERYRIMMWGVIVGRTFRFGKGLVQREMGPWEMESAVRTLPSLATIPRRGDPYSGPTGKWESRRTTADYEKNAIANGELRSGPIVLRWADFAFVFVTPGG